MKIRTKTLMTALVTCTAIVGNAQAVDFSGSISSPGGFTDPTRGTPGLAATYDLSTGYTDWVVWNETSLGGSDQKAGASNLDSVLSFSANSPFNGTAPTVITLQWDETDSESGTAGDTTRFYTFEDSSAGAPSVILSSTATGIGEEGTFTFIGGGIHQTTFSVKVEIGTDVDADLYGSFETDGYIDDAAFVNYFGLFAEIDYSGVTDENAILTWSFISTDNTIGTNRPTANKLRVGAVAIEVVPEPSSLALLGLGGLLVARRRRRA
ncbi:MAG: PEP-CTERM sorting domain-containing protein [Phycisphaeraceae bacterium]